MEKITSNDSFDAYKIENGIQINEKKNSAKKLGLITIVMGIIFLIISFVHIRRVTDWQLLATIFDYTFFYGGIFLLVIGVIFFIGKGLLGGEPISTFNSSTKELTLRGKVMPFSDMSEIKLQVSKVMGKTMVAILFKYKGRRKALVGGTLIMNDTTELQGLIDQMNELIASQ